MSEDEAAGRSDDSQLSWFALVLCGRSISSRHLRLRFDRAWSENSPLSDGCGPQVKE